MTPESEEPDERHVSISAIYAAAVSLIVLWLLSWGLSYASLGSANFVVALAIAGVKAVLVALVFMELATEQFSVQATMLTAIALVSVLIVLTLADVATRAEPPLLPPALEHPAPP
jgi:cytochrome c oxidase subunit 4